MTTAPTLADAGWLREGPLAALLAVLGRDGEEARVVGGAVRNALLDEPVDEVDVATTARPEEVVRRVRAVGFKAVPTGIEHGTVTVVANGRPYEVTTLRRDVETFGRHAKVAFGRDWKADAERRDFTMNALSATADGTVHDDVGGLSDLAARRVRFIGDANARIAEDYLRILRFFRFHAAYGAGDPDADGLRACIAGRAGLAQLSRERVRAELLKLLVARGAAPVLTAMREAGILVTVLGGVPLVADAAAMVEAEATFGLAPDPVRRLGALAVLVPEDADRLRQRLRLANAEHARLASMADGFRRIVPGDESAGRALLYRLGPERFADRVLLAFARASRTSGEEWRSLLALPSRWSAPAFPLKAADLMARGLTKGPALGAALRAAEDAWIAGDFPMAEADLAALADRFGAATSNQT